MWTSRATSPSLSQSSKSLLKVVLQRVTQASVTIEGRLVGSIERGLLVLVGFKADDGSAEIDWMTGKIAGLRVFSDSEGKMNRDVMQCGGEVLVISQFTVYGDTRKGRRPSFVSAAPPDKAESLYEEFIGKLRDRSLKVETGEFGAMMQVQLVNDGPVTLVIER